jgi:cytochrome P450
VAVQTSATFDLNSPEVQGDGFWDLIEELQRQGPLVWVDSHGGYWAATTFDVVLQIAQDWESFTSAQGVAIERPSFEALPHIMPIEDDPPRQRLYRKQVNPHLTIKAVTGLEDSIRAVADELIDQFIDRGSCDIAVDFARKFPGTVFFRLIVHCSDDDFHSVEPSARVISFESDDPQKFADAAGVLRSWVARVFASRAHGDELDDIVNAVMQLNDMDTGYTEAEFLSGLQILAQGGIGTSASAIAIAMRVMSEHPDIQQRVREDPSLIPVLIEECLRLEAPVPIMFRTAHRDVEIAGQRIKKGDKVGLFFGAANRDPAVFDHPNDVDIDRPHYRHLTFGAGVHRCIGSNLARLQVRVALEQLVARLSPFWIPEGAEVVYATMQARGPSSIPLAFAPA